MKLLTQKLIIGELNTVNCDGVVMFADSYIDEKFVQALKNKNLDVCIYNVEKSNMAVKLINYKVDSLTTNSPLMIRKAIEK